MKTIYLDREEKTREIGTKLGELLFPGAVICLIGDLGAGKTTWTQSFGKALGIQQVINSPTFTIMKSYTQGNGQPFYHIDAYRLEGIDQDLGFEDCFDEGICVIEWGNFIANQIPDDHISISIEEGIDEERTI